MLWYVQSRHDAQIQPVSCHHWVGREFLTSHFLNLKWNAAEKKILSNKWIFTSLDHNFFTNDFNCWHEINYEDEWKFFLSRSIRLMLHHPISNLLIQQTLAWIHVRFPHFLARSSSIHRLVHHHRHGGDDTHRRQDEKKKLTNWRVHRMRSDWIELDVFHFYWTVFKLKVSVILRLWISINNDKNHFIKLFCQHSILHSTDKFSPTLSRCFHFERDCCRQ